MKKEIKILSNASHGIFEIGAKVSRIYFENGDKTLLKEWDEMIGDILHWISVETRHWKEYYDYDE